MRDLDQIDHWQPVRGLDISRKISELEAVIPSLLQQPHGFTTREIAHLIGRIEGLRARLEIFSREIDPVFHHDVYDPSHPEAAAELVARKLLEQDSVELKGLTPFWGAGVYALYYCGAHPAYQAISGREIPIYVGKADAKLREAITAKQQGRTLYSRLQEHLKSIRSAEIYADSQLDFEWLTAIRETEFRCRYLVLASAYSGAVEATLIRHWQPVWNKEMRVCIGFGKHGDAVETRANTRSDWDTLHPGRLWATRDGNFNNKRTPDQIQSDVIEHLEHYPPDRIVP